MDNKDWRIGLWETVPPVSNQILPIIPRESVIAVLLFYKQFLPSCLLKFTTLCIVRKANKKSSMAEFVLNQVLRNLKSRGGPS